jgi:dihydrofolate reductase
MGKLIYSAIASADGYIEDGDGGFGWAEPDEELMRFVNELERPAGTYLYGRRMYETLVYWETADAIPDLPSYVREWTRIWQAADKIVFSRTLESTSSARTRLERDFDPDLVRQLKSDAGRNITVGGATLAGQALQAGLVDEVQLILMPVAVGGGKPVFPRGLRVNLRLLETRRFAGGAVFLRYLPKN